MKKVDTSEYVDTHGKQPRGQGRWVFMIGRDGAWTEQDYSHSLKTYTEAKKDAIQLAKSLGADTIILLP